MIARLHNSDFPGHVCGNFYEYRGIGITKKGARYYVDILTSERPFGFYVSSLAWAKKIIDKRLKQK